MPTEKKQLPRKDLERYDMNPLYIYTEKDSLNRITVLKESTKDSYLIAGRYSGYSNESRLYNPLTEEERKEVEKLVRIGRKDATISFL